MKLSVVVPVYNEEKIIAKTAAELDSYLLCKLGEGQYEIVFANDGSCDKTLENIPALDSIKVVGYSQNRGKGCAVRTGVEAATGDFILFTDCDLAYGCERIGEFYDSFVSMNGVCDVLIGSRRRAQNGYEGYTFLRRLMSKTFYLAVKVGAGFSYSDSQCGIKGFSEKCAHDVFPRCREDGFAFDVEVLKICDILGYNVGETAAVVINHGDSKVHPLRDSARMLRAIGRINKNTKKIKKASVEEE